MAHTVLRELPMLAILLTLLASPYTAIGCYTGIFIFGDAYNDAGNSLLYSNPDYIGHLPYGMTYFHRSTGRLSDGRIIPDFLAEAFGLPFPPPYLGMPGGHDIRRGVNFAITGATALDPSFFLERGMEDIWTDFTLSAQIGWFKQLLPSLCSSESECRDVLGRSLFLVGEIGINDFNYPLMDGGRNLTEIWTFVPYVVDALSVAINELLDLGARALVVPGVFPNGCVPAHLTDYQAKGKGWSKDAYDPVTGCLKALNKLSEYYDLQLQEALDRLRHQNPHATIIYANLYKASMSIFVSPEQNGFDKTTLRVCCGGGGPYNYNESAKCGSPGSTVCNDPSRAVYWTRFHFTEAAYKFMAVSILEGPNAEPPIAHICPQMQQCKDFLGRSLILFGEIGGDDFGYPLTKGRSLNELRTYIPTVLDGLSSAINELIKLGARTLVVPGFFPIGCIPAYLTINQSPNKDDYDTATGCLKRFSKFSEDYDLQLQDALDLLRQQNPHATIIYASYYKALMMILESPEKYGFDKRTLEVCCGGGGPYNFNDSTDCGCPGSTVCDDPSRAVYWDGYHYTEAAYKVMARSILEGPNADQPIAHACPQMQGEDDLARYAY